MVWKNKGVIPQATWPNLGGRSENCRTMLGEGKLEAVKASKRHEEICTWSRWRSHQQKVQGKNLGLSVPPPTHSSKRTTSSADSACTLYHGLPFIPVNWDSNLFTEPLGQTEGGWNNLSRSTSAATSQNRQAASGDKPVNCRTLNPTSEIQEGRRVSADKFHGKVYHLRNSIEQDEPLHTFFTSELMPGRGVIRLGLTKMRWVLDKSFFFINPVFLLQRCFA